jgi:hypothetical protein
MKKILLPAYKENSHLIGAWFHMTFGEGDIWNGEIIEPVQLKSKFVWTYGKTRVGSGALVPVIWCTDDTYTLFALKWL